MRGDRGGPVVGALEVVGHHGVLVRLGHLEEGRARCEGGGVDEDVDRA